MSVDTLLARGLLPDAVVRAGIRRLLRQRLREEDRGSEAAQRAYRAVTIMRAPGPEGGVGFMACADDSEISGRRC